MMYTLCRFLMRMTWKSRYISIYHLQSREFIKLATVSSESINSFRFQSEALSSYKARSRENYEGKAYSTRYMMYKPEKHRFTPKQRVDKGHPAVHSQSSKRRSIGHMQEPVSTNFTSSAIFYPGEMALATSSSKTPSHDLVLSLFPPIAKTFR